MFPIFFLAAVDTKTSELVCNGQNDCQGYEGKPAVVRVTGSGASFIGLTEQINDLLLFMNGANRLGFVLDYVLRPGKNYVELNVTIRNEEDTKYLYQTFGAVPSVAGMIGLFGKRNKVFIPGIAGYNIRFSIEHIFGSDAKLKAPAIPGLVADFIGSRGKNGVSYGLVAEPSNDNYVYKYKDEFAKLDGNVPIHEGSILVPLEGSSITACFSKSAPTKLNPKGEEGSTFSYKFYIVIGDGSVSSIRDAQLEIHKRPKGLVSGQVFEQDTEATISHAKVVAYTRNGEGSTPGKRVMYTEFVTHEHGRFTGYMEPGTYYLLARNNRLTSEEIKIIVEKDKKHFQKISVPRPGRVLFTVRDSKGNLIPAKVTALATVGDFENGKCTKQHPVYCMYDPAIGAPEVNTDFRVGLTCEDGAKCNGHVNCKGNGDEKCLYRMATTTEFREDFFVSNNGRGELHLRALSPGRSYKLVASRGIEYETDTKEIKIKPGELKIVEFRLGHSVPTKEMISADLHVHTNLSHDSAISDRDRVTSFAAEGVDFFVTTDHNRIRDMQPVVEVLGLERWLKTMIGIELTTFDMGHFNAFPLRLDLLKFNGGAPSWFRQDGADARYTSNEAFPPGEKDRPLEGLRKGITPTEMFNSMRKLGKISPEQTIIQINHPRDSIFGYFNTYNLSGDTSLPVYTSGLTSPNLRTYDIDKYDNSFDAIEVYNGKRLDLIWHWRIPPGITVPSGYGGKVGTIIRTENEGRGNVAVPGGGSDWFNMLNLGYTYTATANSDTHDLGHEAGVPRNYLLTGFDHPQKLTNAALVDIIRKNKLFLTNGPILYLTAGTSADGPFSTNIGETLKVAQGKVYFNLKVLAASWVDVSEIIVYKNGRVVRTIAVDETTDIERFNKTLPFDVDADAWFVFTVKGKKDLWPVFRADEIEPFQIGQAVSLIQETLLANLPISISFSDSACLLPALAQGIRPYAITNPIWVDVDGDGKYTPNACKTFGERGVRCYPKNASCSKGLCVEKKTPACTEDKDCGNLGQCVDGGCVVDPCKGITCAKAFLACDNTKPCPNDQCAADAKTCSDGTSCKADSDCTGKGDGLCRYCACPPARKACKGDGAPCNADSDCGKNGKCETARYCFPTSCALGYCEPTFPVCSEDQVQKSNHLFLRTGKTNKLETLLKEHSPNQKIEPVDKYTINKVKSYFLYFDHKH
ncbi:MAG TPA: hypothetical protein DCE42_18655 [Myxococcales bacterium]|nr:hypothetical protein [Myxococcales bacterium]